MIESAKKKPSTSQRSCSRAKTSAKKSPRGLPTSRGVKVRVLLDNGYASSAVTAKWKYVPALEFKKAGIACKYDDEPAKLHHKIVILIARSLSRVSQPLRAAPPPITTRTCRLWSRPR
ncbi:MAG: hypothetical protein U0792_24285 [Gemmataceae bacterium]